jgi:hypothetical protein
MILRILPSQRNWRNLCNIITVKHLYLLIGCDSNAHHIVWGNTNCIDRGKALVEFLNSSNLEILNQGNEPTFCSGGRLSISLRKHATVFQAEVYAILSCVHEIKTQIRPEKYVSIYSDSQVALKTLQAANTSPLVQQCQKALNDISAWHNVGLYCVLGMLGYKVIILLTSLQEMVLFKGLLDLSLSWGSLGRT